MPICSSHIKKFVWQRPTFELADILRRYLPDFLKKHYISPWQDKALFDIQVCRTAACGGHIEICDHCSFEQPAYNSCHNRHCPKCQGISRRIWVAERMKELLPVPYFHVVFTLPHRLNDLVLYNKQILYNIFYRAAAYTLLKFGKDPKYLGGQLGFIGVLHTWGSSLSYHVHWHFIIPGGGLSRDGKWNHLPYHEKYLFPGSAMAKVVAGVFIKHLRQAYNDGKITIPDSQEDLSSPYMFEYFLNELASDRWVNYVKRPFGGPEEVVKYIGRYTHRVAISNHSLMSIDGGKIKFSTRNYKKGGTRGTTELSADEFIRRFLLHILPKRFRKIRYGGFMAQSIREAKLALARQSLAEQNIAIEMDHSDFDFEIEDFKKCPRCHIGIMRAIELDGDFCHHNWPVSVNSS